MSRAHTRGEGQDGAGRERAEHPLPAAHELASGVLASLAERGERLAVAEYLTGGRLVAELTGVPGASRVVRGSVTAYATDLKESALGVDGALLRERGAVDPQVAREMATGVRAVLCADWGVSTTGVAGPEPQDGQPVGTVYVAVAGPRERVVAARLRVAQGLDRAAIRSVAVRGGLELLRSELVAHTTGTTGNRPGGMDVCSPE